MRSSLHLPLISCVTFVFILHETLCERVKPQLTFLGDLQSKKKDLDYQRIINGNINPSVSYNVTVTITPSKLTTPNGCENININWYNKYQGGSYDWIGIYSPANSSNDEYLDYFHTDGIQNGSYQARIWNMRDSYQARYFGENNNTDYILLGISNIAEVIRYQPLQGHLSLTNNSPYEMQIRWVSGLVENAIVELGTSSGNYSVKYKASNYTYDTSNMCGGSASIISPTQFRDPGYIYTVIADKLAPDTVYYYRFGCVDCNSSANATETQESMMSDEYHFKTSSNDSKKDFQFIMYGDQGTYTNAYSVISNIESILDSIDLILHIGDISYAWGNGYTWEIWSNMVSNIASHVPYMISVGNHEYDHTSGCNNGKNDLSGVGGDGYHPIWGNQGDDSNGECGAPTYYRFDAPLNGNSVFWYSFNYNSVHFIMLSSEHNYNTTSTPVMKWLINDLEYYNNYTKNNNNGGLSWVVVCIHRPLYESEIAQSDNIVGNNLIELLEPTLFKYGVDLVLAGHYHAYERICAVYNYTCIGQENGGITHLTVGTAGIDLDNANYNDVKWSVYRDEIDWGFARFYVNHTTLVAQFVTNQMGVVDSLVLKK